MAKRTGTRIRKARHKLTKGLREKGKIGTSRFLKTLAIGDRVTLKAEPAYHKGCFDMVFQGKAGIVDGKKGSCYEVLIKDGNKQKCLIVHPVHLIKVGDANGQD